MIPSTFAQTATHFAPNGTRPTRFQVLGERSSGTNFVKRLLGRNTVLRPTEALGWKHGHPQMMAIPADLVVLVAVRNVLGWLRSMHAKPWHTPAQIQAMPMAEFLRSPWTTIIDRDRYFQPHSELGILGQPLQQDRDLLTGAPYENLLHLRRGKLQSHLSHVNRGCAFVLVGMEAAIANPEAFLEGFCTAFDLPPPTAPFRPVIKRLGSKFRPSVDTRPETPASLSAEDIRFVKSQLDLDQEAALGYIY